MKVLLFRPNNPLMEATPIPLGLGYIAGALRKERGDTIEIIDCRKLRWTLPDVRQKIRDVKPDVIGITVINFDAKSAHELAAGAKAELPEVPIIMGGPYASANREALLDDTNVDVALVGEGEATIVELLNTIEAGESLEKVKGIIFRKDGEKIFTGPREPIADIDTLEMAWDLLDPRSYYGMVRNQNSLKKDPRALLIFTSRGCPYNCIFCHNIFGKKFRPRSPKSVLDEIEMLIDRYDCRELEIIDDTFSQDLDRAKAICRGIIDRKFKLNLMLPNGIRADRTDEEFFDLLRDSGFFRVTFAVESACPRVQKIIKKNINLDKVKWAIEEVAKRGMLATGFFIMGFPTETYDEMLMTANWAADSKLHIASFFYLKPFPGTEVAAMVQGDFSDVNLDDYTALSPVNLSAATDSEIFSANKYAYRHFYLSPRRIARIIKIVPKNFKTILNAWICLCLLVKDLRNK